MGGAITTQLRQQETENPENVSAFREKMAAQLAKEFASYRDDKLSEEEVRQRIVENLKIQEGNLLADYGEEKQTVSMPDPPELKQEPVQESSSIQLKFSFSSSNRTLEERSIFFDKVDSHAKRLLNKADHTYLVCVDGSDTADLAFKTSH